MILIKIINGYFTWLSSGLYKVKGLQIIVDNAKKYRILLSKWLSI